MKLVRLKKTGRKVAKKADGVQDDFRAGVQLELAAKNALKKARELFLKIVNSKDVEAEDLADAKEQLNAVTKSLSYL